MLTDVTTEEEFEVKEGRQWYDTRDLEHDLHLAAELGKTLLERNNELEEGLQHMYSTNQEQQQEIVYLAKQVDLLRQVNEQHAKVYEQLDGAARDLELGNQRLVQDKRNAQHRIHRLTETIDGLQVHLEDLQKQLEELQVTPPYQHNPEQVEQSLLVGESLCCLKELHPTHLNRCVLPDDDRDTGSWLPTETGRVEEEHAALQHSVRVLRTQLGAECARRQEAEQEAELTGRENSELERQLEEVERSCGRERVLELEAKLEEARKHWRSEAGGAGKADVPLFPPEEWAGPEEDTGAGLEVEVGPGGHGRVSKSALRSWSGEEIRSGHELTCIRRAHAAKRRGVSLLSEVDAQYSALQARYEELLHRCQQGADRQSHKAVQTRDHAHSALATPTQHPASAMPLCSSEDSQPPEYRALFQQIFTCIQKTREDLSQAQ